MSSCRLIGQDRTVEHTEREPPTQSGCRGIGLLAPPSPPLANPFSCIRRTPLAFRNSSTSLSALGSNRAETETRLAQAPVFAWEAQGAHGGGPHKQEGRLTESAPRASDMALPDGFVHEHGVVTQS